MENTFVNFEEIKKSLYVKINKNKMLTEEEIKWLLHNCEVADNIYYDNDRFHRQVDTVIKLLDKYFLIQWWEGLTELQTDEGYAQPIEVREYVYNRIMEITEWLPVRTN